MRVPLFIGALLLAGAAQDSLCWEWGQMDPNAAIVKPSYDNLNNVSHQTRQAQESKSSAARSLQYAQAKLKHAWTIWGKAHKKEEANRALAAYQAKAAKAKQLEEQRLGAADDYVQKEEEYRAKTGNYYNPENYGYWKGILESSGYSSKSPPAEEPEKSLDQRVQDARKEMAKPVKSIGDLMERSRRISSLGDDVVVEKSKLLHAYEPPAPVKPLKGTAVWEPGTRRGEEGTLASGSMTGGSAPDPLSAKVLLSPRRDGLPAVPKTDARVSSARDLLAKGDKAGALKALDAALSSNPKDARAWAMKADILNGMRRFEEAERAALKALRLDPGDSAARKSLLWAQLHQKKYVEAVETADKYIAANPDDPRGYLMRAFAYEGLGMRAQMLADLEKAAALDPTYKAHLKLARSGHRLFDPDAKDNERLLDALEVSPEGKGAPFLALGALFLAGAAAVLALLWLRSRGGTVSPVSAAAPAAKSPSAAPGAAAVCEPVPAPEPPAPGRVLAGKYRLARMEHEDPSCRIWSARDLSLERPVLLKEMRDAPGEDPAAARALHREEARLLAALHDPRILDVYEFLDLPSGFFWIFELAPGRSLRRLLLSGGRLPWGEARRILLDAAAALCVAHAKGVPHGNLRPEYILVTESGLSKLMEFSPAARRRSVKAAYMAPEAAAAPSPLADVYALGVCLYEALAGHVPDSRLLPSGPLLPDLPPEADALLKAALEMDPAKRLPSAEEFRSRLERIA